MQTEREVLCNSFSFLIIGFVWYIVSKGNVYFFLAKTNVGQGSTCVQYLIRILSCNIFVRESIVGQYFQCIFLFELKSEYE